MSSEIKLSLLAAAFVTFLVWCVAYTIYDWWRTRQKWKRLDAQGELWDKWLLQEIPRRLDRIYYCWYREEVLKNTIADLQDDAKLDAYLKGRFNEKLQDQLDALKRNGRKPRIKIKIDGYYYYNGE